MPSIAASAFKGASSLVLQAVKLSPLTRMIACAQIQHCPRSKQSLCANHRVKERKVRAWAPLFLTTHGPQQQYAHRLCAEALRNCSSKLAPAEHWAISSALIVKQRKSSPKKIFRPVFASYRTSSAASCTLARQG